TLLPPNDPLHRGRAFIHQHDQVAAATSYEIARAIVNAPNAAVCRGLLCDRDQRMGRVGAMSQGSIVRQRYVRATDVAWVSVAIVTLSLRQSARHVNFAFSRVQAPRPYPSSARPSSPFLFLLNLSGGCAKNQARPMDGSTTGADGNTPMSSSTTIIGSNVGRARRNMSQLWQVPTFLLGLLAFLAVAVSAPWRHPPQFWEFEKQVQILRDGLDQQRDGDQLVAQAEQTLLRLPMFPGRAGEVHFLAGSAYDRQAKQKPAAYAKALWPRAVEHLEKATALGVADADKFPLQYRLGYALYHQGRDVPRALELMASAVEKGAEQPLQGYQFLVQANLKLPTPNLDAALAASRRILDLTPERETEAIAQARLQHGEMLMRKDLYADASKELERIGAKASRAVRIKA